MHLPKNWKRSIRSSVLHVISLAHYAIVQSHGRTAKNDRAHRHLAVELDRLRTENAFLREELRIKDVRMAHRAPHRRPHYPPTERMAILECRAMRGWNLAQTAATFMVTVATIREWIRRLDEQGEHPLVQLREPVNKFPDFVGYVVRRLKTLCPTMGERKIAETLARAGLHLGATTVGRILKSPPKSALKVETDTPRGLRAKRPSHVWNVDLSVVPIVSGFWTSWLPNTLPQCWPSCWWIVVIVDQFSRRVMGTAVFRRYPKSEQVRAILGRTISETGTAPKHLVCDRGPQFDSHGFRRWCGRRSIQVRYGAIGKQGSIAVVERLIRTLKESLRRLILVPPRREAIRKELTLIVGWYNSTRPHTSLDGRTPDEVYYAKFPACRRPRYEPRTKWPNNSPCARPWALTRGRPGARLELEMAFHGDRKHLPIVTLKRVA